MRPARLSVWPPLPVDLYLRRPVKALPFPLDRPGYRLYAKGRQAIWWGVQALGLKPGDEVLVPAYHHGSEVEAIVRAGLRPVYYEVGENGAPDRTHLERMLRPSTRALHLTHFLGFPQAAAEWRRWCDAQGLLLLEDAAQAWMASDGSLPVGAHGHLAILCLYKTFGLPDGAVLTVGGLPLPRRLGNRSRPSRVMRRHAAWIAARLPLAGPHVASRRAGRHDEMELGDPDAPPTAGTRALLARLTEGDAAAARRSNYRSLLDHLGAMVAPPFDVLPATASPFVFPVETDSKRRLLERLDAQGIHALDLWSTPHRSLPDEGFEISRRRRARTVGLPVHQELRGQDLERIVTAVRRPSPARARPLEVETVTDLGLLRDDWRALGESSGNVFSTWEWVSTWWRYFGEGHELRLVACRDGNGRLLAILPLYLWSQVPFRVVRFLGHDASDELGPVCAPGDRMRVAEALRQVIADAGWDLLLGERLAGDVPWSAILGGRSIRRQESPVLHLGSASANVRDQVSRRERRLRAHHDVAFRLAGDADRIDADMDTLFTLHDARWQGASSGFSALKEFHREFAAAALARGWLRLWFLEVAGRAVAAWYGFRIGGAQSHYQAGRDPVWDKWSVGSVLLAYTIRAAFEEGATEYRFLRGGENYKYRFADADPGVETVGVAGTAAGAAALLAATAFAESDPIRALVRRRL